MRIFYMKRIHNETDPLSRRPYILPIDNVKLYNTQESLWWDGELLDVINNGNEPTLLALSTKELNVDVEFLTKLKEAYSSCIYFFEENSFRWKSQKTVKSSYGLFRYYNLLVIHRLTQALKKVLLLDSPDNVGHSNYHHVLSALLKRYWSDKNAFDCKAYCQNYSICNTARSDRMGAASVDCYPLGVHEYP